MIWFATGTNKSTPLTYYKYNLLSLQHTVKILSANSTCIPDTYNKTGYAHINTTSKHNHKTIVAVEKQWVIHILSVCLQPWLTDILSSCTILSSVDCLALPYFPTLSHVWHYFLKKLFKMKRVFIFSTTNVWNIPHCTKNWARYYHKFT